MQEPTISTLYPFIQSLSPLPLIDYQHHRLPNGLDIYLHQDTSTPLAAVALLYRVGSRDESPERTGYAHLFEHLMFTGSEHAPDFDAALQAAGGDNNAVTSTDFTIFYESLPAENLELALWLESDRMQHLKLTKKRLKSERKVVLEEFKESCVEEPYGDSEHYLMKLAYRDHPYRWPVIGLCQEHIAAAELSEISSFYDRWYGPDNAVLSVCGNIDYDETLRLIDKWFGDIETHATVREKLPPEPAQTAPRHLTVRAAVPSPAIYLAFRMPGRLDADYYPTDLLSDVLGNGPSARLYRRLVRDREVLNHVDASITGYLDPGLFIVEARPAEGVSMEAARTAIWEELAAVRTELVSERELQKVKNIIESKFLWSEVNILNRALDLATFAALDHPEWINNEGDLYQAVTAEDLRRVAAEMLRPENCSELVYEVSEEEE
ncbi:MAG: pitrilysin family protein [Saprospiraceae bacterium]